jgi:stearoyl-CoA desaturase (delta-9 desaturase)
MASSSSSGPVPAEVIPDGTTDYVPLRTNKKYDLKKPRKSNLPPQLDMPRTTQGLTRSFADISETPMTWTNMYKHINWLNTILIVIVPMIGLVSSYWVPLQLKTLAFAVAYYFYTGLGITAGMSTLTKHSMVRMFGILNTAA